MSSATDTAASDATGTTTGADELVRALRLLGVTAALTPPPATSPRWYRRGGARA